MSRAPGLALRIAWRHLQSARPPRWTGAVAIVGGALTALGALAVAWSSGQNVAAPDEGIAAADLVGLVGLLVLIVGLLVLGFAAVLRRFTLLVAITLYSIAQGCAALIVVLSLLGGLEADLRDRLLGHRAHLRVSPPAGSEIVAPASLVAELRALPEFAGVSHSLEGPVMIRSGFARAGVTLVGVDPELHAEVSGLPDEVIEGDYAAFVRPELLPRRPFPGAPELEVRDDDTPLPDGADSVDPPGPTGQAGDDEDSGSWEDPSEEIPKLRAEGAIPPARAPVGPAAEDEDEDEEGGGWEDPAEEIPRLRAEGVIPPARRPALPAPETAGGDEADGSEASGGASDRGEAPRSEAVGSEADGGDGDAGGESGAPGSAMSRPVLVPALIGVELAAELSVGVGDPLQLITPEGRLTPAGLVPGVLAARVAAVYSTGIYNDDRDFIYIPIADAQALLRAPDAATSLALRLRDPAALDAGRAAAAAVAGPPFVVEDWRQLNRGLFSAMFLEKVAMFVGLLFVILVAAFGILATNLMSVVERAPEIAILKAMGARDRGIAAIFALEACLVGVVGSLAGVAAGLGLCAWFGERGVPLHSSAFTLQALPLRTDPREVGLVVAAALLLVGLASVAPARAAASVRPVAGLRRGE